MSGGLFGVGSGEVILILLIILLVMGPDRLPQIARAWGQAIRFIGKFSNTWNLMNAELMRKIEEEAKSVESTLRLEDEASPPPTTPPAVSEPPLPDDDPDPLLNTIAPPEFAGPPAPAAASEPPAPDDDSDPHLSTITPPELVGPPSASAQPLSPEVETAPDAAETPDV